MTITLGYSATHDYTIDGTNDEVQFQDAIDALVMAGGGKLIIDVVGNVNLSDTVVVAGDFIIIEGLGKSTVINNSNTTSLIDRSVIRVEGDGCQIRNLKAITADYNVGNCINFYGATDGIIENVWTEKGIDGIQVQNCENITLKRINTFNAEHGIGLTNSKRIRLDGYITDSDTTNHTTQRGLGIWECQDVSANNLDIRNCHGTGIFVRADSTSQHTSGININNFVIRDPNSILEHGIRIRTGDTGENPTQIYGVNIDNGHIEAYGPNYGHGIDILSDDGRKITGVLLGDNLRVLARRNPVNAFTDTSGDIYKLSVGGEFVKAIGSENGKMLFKNVKHVLFSRVHSYKGGGTGSFVGMELDSCHYTYMAASRIEGRNVIGGSNNAYDPDSVKIA